MSDQYFEVVNGVLTEITQDKLESMQAEWSEQRALTPVYDLEALRSARNSRLSETDWWVLPDKTPTQAQLDYRQALRDITDTYTSLDDVIWPEKP